MQHQQPQQFDPTAIIQHVPLPVGRPVLSDAQGEVHRTRDVRRASLGFPAHVLPEYLEALGVPFRILEQDTYSVVKRVVPEGKTTCGLCSRLRRGALYNFAAQNAVTRIALGHHRDDIIETFFLNLFNGGRIKAMPPKLLSDDGRHVVIRPLAYCAEEDIRQYAGARNFPIIPCNLCGSQPNLQRQAIKAMLTEWKNNYPGRVENIFRAMSHVSPSQLADRELFAGSGRAAGQIYGIDRSRPGSATPWNFPTSPFPRRSNRRTPERARWRSHSL